MSIGRGSRGEPLLKYDSTIEEFELVRRYWTNGADAGENDTHVEVFRIDRNSDPRDAVQESNFRFALRELMGTEENHPTGIDDDIAQDVWNTVNGGFSGTRDPIIVVRVHGKDGKYTHVFREAYRLIMKSMNGTPFIDEEEFEKVEDEIFESEVQEAITIIMEGTMYPMDTKQEKRLVSIMVQDAAYEALDPHADCGSVSEDAVLELYSRCRDTYFSTLAQPHLDAMNTPPPGQQSLPL